MRCALPFVLSLPAEGSDRYYLRSHKSVKRLNKRTGRTLYACIRSKLEQTLHYFFVSSKAAEVQRSAPVIV